MATASLAAVWPVAIAPLAPRARWAVAAGAAIAVINALAAYVLILWSEGRSTRVFFRAVLGGMLGRMTFMLAAVLGAVLGLRLPLVPLVLSLLAYFVAFLALEMAVV